MAERDGSSSPDQEGTQILRAIQQLADRLPPSRDPYDELRDELRRQSERMTRIEAWHDVWRWVFPIGVVVGIAVIQVAIALYQSTTR